MIPGLLRRVVPAFRAGLHAGPVVAGECGDSKQEIVYFGDTINTAARLRSACKDLKVPLLVSGELVRQIVVPANVPLEWRGRLWLSGRSEETQTLGVSYLEGERKAPRA